MAKVLVVDDEANLRKVLATMLRRTGYDVTVAADGEQGLAEFLKSGADIVVTDLVMPKMGGMELLQSVIAKAARTHDIAQRNVRVDGRARAAIVGESEEMQEIFKIIEKVADTPSTVLITGESGTGKELIATALHEGSSRRNKPLIRINCAAIPKDLMESELFGYERGAFTGAVTSKPGALSSPTGARCFST